ncbi:MAG: peptidoglycan editing factor PgeF [Defluviitaleaceae bacterium]|nr:peptidoglycan editing factor PgeF [Defluviitaleaceae bacterium]
MKKVANGNLIYYKFESIDTTNCFTTKHGGFSTGYTHSMNMDKSKEENTTVFKNHDIICSEMNILTNSLTGVLQKHTSNVVIVNKKNISNNITKYDTIGGCDGLITNDKSISLMTLHADCPALYFYDSVKEIIALSHSGWRGTVKSIASITIKKMMKHFDTNPKNIKAGISPSIGFCCFEVNEDVKNEFCNTFEWANEYIKKTENEKYKIDLTSINKRIMQDCGVTQVETAKMCTKCMNDTFYSHRVSGFKRGNMAAIIALKH